MSKKISRKFYKYTLQAHNPSGAYEGIFEALRRVPKERRLAQFPGKSIFIEDVNRLSGGMMVRAFLIHQETDYTTFDLRNYSTSDTSLPDNKRFAIAAHGYFMNGGRKFIFEYVRGGPKIEETVSAIQQILHANSKLFGRLRLTATPVIGSKFLSDVSRLERIRTVRIDIAEPNASWTDWDDSLHELGEESGAGHISLQATAPRAESLSKTKGIMKVLREALKAPNSHLEKALVEGRFPDETGSRIVRTDKHQEFESRQVTTDSGGSTSAISAVAVFNLISENIPDKSKG